MVFCTAIKFLNRTFSFVYALKSSIETNRHFHKVIGSKLVLFIAERAAHLEPKSEHTLSVLFDVISVKDKVQFKNN